MPVLFLLSRNFFPIGRAFRDKKRMDILRIYAITPKIRFQEKDIAEMKGNERFLTAIKRKNIKKVTKN